MLGCYWSSGRQLLMSLVKMKNPGKLLKKAWRLRQLKIPHHRVLVVSVERENIYLLIIPPALTKLKGEYTGFTLSVCPSIRLSACGQNRICSVSSSRLVGSISYLHILSSNFKSCVVCKVCFKIWNFGKFFEFVTLTWDPIWLNSMGNHEAAGGILRTQVF